MTIRRRFPRSVRLTALALMAACNALADAPAALAEDAWSGHLRIATDYISEGASRSHGEPQFALIVQHRLGGAAYAAVKASTADATGGADAQTNAFVGVKGAFAGWDVGARVTHRRRWNARGGIQDWSFEGRLEAARSFGPNRLRLRLDATPDNWGATRQAYFPEIELSRRLGARWSVLGALAHREEVAGVDYGAWHVGAAAKLGRGRTLDLRWYDTDGHENGSAYKARVVAALSVDF